ncbi:hypothetical protein L210DRAFT_3763021 [Boletus edulis BED1]|uniref:E3 ubiquitin-protein ligase listerin n=1 Tax=Boletus edulis BED1 TaxID=1328754 RepID=A0AAD4GAR1_BOLED|nr:hypothetical protein L210DRAFT_3763021 [Boletus edulis BED1]
MAKGQKSSATSGTRKKNARKATQGSAAPQSSPPPKQSRPKGAKNHKLSKREAREQHKKVYIPPIKPAPPVLDPLDTTGLAHLLPPELVVVLKALGKKDAVTRGKAIEELAKWVEDAIKEQAARDSGHDRYEEESGKTDMIVKMLPVWLHRSPVLFTHPERRLRHLAASLHSTLLRLNEAREALLAWTSEIASQSELETLLGTWAMLAYDVDRGVAMVGMRSWVDFVTASRGQAADKQDEHCTGPQTRRTRSQLKMTLNPRLLISLFRFAQDTVLDPQGLHTALNPAPVLPPAVSPPQQGHKSVPQGKSAAQAKGKKGSTMPQSQQKKSGRYVPPSSESPSPTSSLLPDRVVGESVAENDSDRAGRLRVGALGVVRWILDNWPEVDSASATDLAVLTALLSSLPFWSTLHPAAVLSRSSPFCPFSVALFGHGQPQVRQAAWALVGTLIKVFKGKLPASLIRILSTVVLRSAWVETDIGVRATLGAPLMIFLRDYSQAWTIDMENASKGYDDLDANIRDTERDDSDSNSGAESETDSESEGNGDDDDFTGIPTESPPNGQLLSEAYTEFLQFLELGCSGSPPEGYPLVVVVLAGIPKSILPTTLPPVSPLGPGDKEENEQASNIHPISQLLTSFWAPLDAGLLDKRTVASSWLKAFSECLVLIVRRGVHAENTTHVKDDAKNLLASQFSRLWVELVTKRLRVEETEVAAVIVRTADRIGKIGDDLFDASFDALCQPILDSLHTTDGTLDLAPVLFYHFTSTFALGTHAGQKTRGAVEAYMRRVTEVLETVLRSSDQVLIANAAKDPLTALVKLMDTFGPSLFDDQSFTSRTDAIFVAHSLSLVRVSTSGVLAYLGHRSKSSDQSQGQLQTQVFWTELLGTVASSPTKVALSLLSPLVGASLPIHLRGASPTMDDLIERLVSNVIGGVGRGNEEVAVAKILSAPAPFISFGCLATIASMLSNSVVTFVNARLRLAGVSESTTGLDGVPDLAEVGPIVGLVRELADSGYEFTGDLGAELYTSVFLVGYAVPYQGEASGDKWVEDAKALWRLWVSQEGDRQREMMDIAGSLVKEKLKSVVVDEKAETRPEYIIQCITPSPPGIRIDPLSDILPSHEEFDTMLDSSSLPSSTTSPSLALLDPTLPTSSDTPTPSLISRKYARTVSALLAHLTASRTVARSNLWALRHILVLGFYANEYLRVEDSLAMFDVTRDHLVDILEKVKSLTTYLLGRVEDGVHAKVVNMLMSKDGVAALEDGSLASFVISVTRRAKDTDSVRATAVLGIVLQHLFSDATKDDADLWLALARKLERTAPQTTITILSAITAHAPEPSKLDRYRNELAASLTGVHPGAASTTGLVALRLLAATAPDPDSDVVFLPQQRAVNVMKACQAWVAADEDDEDGVDEDVESAMTLVFFYLAPILQNVPGSHWDFIWDVMENNLESCSLEDSATLTTLGRTLRLVIAIDDLALTNKPLRAKWDERKTTVLGLIKDMIAVNTVTMPYSEPRTLCRQLALSVIQDMPSEMMNEKTLPSMCHLLGDQSPEVQRMGYHLLHNAARKRTEHYVIEAGVDTEDMVTPEIPPELLAILQQSLGLGEALDLDEQPVPRNKEVSGYLLAWMITFDLFIDASMKVRSGYFNHMRSLDVICQYFIPNVFDILGLFSGGKQVFKLDVWAVDEFHLETFEPESPLSLRLLAAHLYHRALLTVPALIRSWILDCTDKQLLTRVVDYTSSYFSPGIIKAELAQVRQSGASSELSSTENLTVKVSPASGEVTASYTVDEQTLELSIRMPSDWPLHRLEVRDTKMVGVSGDKWRAWILGVQQVVWQQNGRIVDALTLFTKNVTLHFSGQVECAICYSIISVMDASLPQKPCKTCKNRFHASCLYKWFKTSHSSSCPLCRSDIL